MNTTSPQPSTRRLASALAAAAVLATAASAQSFHVFDGPAAANVEVTGPPVAPTFPNGPVLGGFPLAPVVAIAPTSPDGGMTVDRVNDTVYAADGVTIAEYAGGVPIKSFAAPITFRPVTGISWDSGAGGLWVTNGTIAGLLAPPAMTGGTPTVLVQPFPLPALPSGVLYTGISWDPLTGSLFLVDQNRFVTNVVPGGFPGPFFGAIPFPIPPVVPPPPGGPLTGITVDPASSFLTGIPILYLLDSAGFVIAIDATGAPAPATLYASAPVFAANSAWPAGIGFSARGISYGTGGDTSGLTPPTIGTIGQALSPNPTFTTTISGAAVNSTAILYGSQTGPIFPAAIVLGLPVLINPAPVLLTIGSTTTDGAGNGTLLSPLPSGLGLGTIVDVQWLVLGPTSLQTSDAIHMTISAP